MAKSGGLYLTVLASWAALIGGSAAAFAATVRAAADVGPAAATLAVMSALFISYFWLNGTKDVVYTLRYHLVDRRRPRTVPACGTTGSPHVVLVYCTYNDFEPASLRASMRQDHDDVETVILDDSTRPEFQARVDAFAREHGVRVVRRPDRTAFKAGNLNHYLQKAAYDYFVILDSDEIIPPHFVTRALDYFAAGRDVGIVQANHVATRNQNRFMRTFHVGVDSHWPAYQTVKARFGFLSLLGHGAMVSRACYEAAGGFPDTVAEDLALSIAAREKGYFVDFAADITCEEEYPVDYLAFRKRHAKWTEGNMEFIRRFTGTILRSPMRWYEKLDIVLFTYALPLTALFSVYVVIHVIALPLIGYRIDYPAWMLVPTVVFLLAPMLNDVLFHARRMPVHRLGWYLLHSVLLYGSMFFVSLRASVKAVVKGSVFHVTPKVGYGVSFRDTLALNRGELAFGLVLGTVACLLTGSILPVVLLVAPAFFSTYLARTHNTAPAVEPADVTVPLRVVGPRTSARTARHRAS